MSHFRFFSGAILKNEKTQTQVMLIIYLIYLNMSKVSFPFIINIKIVNILHSSFILSSKPSVHFMLTAHLDPDWPHFKCSPDARGE